MAGSEAMSPKERWLAAIAMKPLDRLPFWPKLDAAYPRAQDAPFSGMGIAAIHDWVGSDKHVATPACVKEVRKRTSVKTVTQGDTRTTVYRTPYGEMEMITKFDVSSQSWHPVAFPVRTPEDIRQMTDFYSDITVELDESALERAEAQVKTIGDDAVTCCNIGKSPLMHWVEFLAGVESAHYLLHDCEADVTALFQAMHRVILEKTEIIAAHSPADILYMVENTSTTLVSPAQYRRYCFGHIRDYGEITRRAGRMLVLHMCGHLKDLLGDLSALPAEAFEAFTSPTLGNTTLLDGRTGCPDKCLIGGTNAVLWTRPAEEIIARIEKDLDALPHHRGVVVTSAGVMPPLCKPETIRTVCDWVREYPVRL